MGKLGQELGETSQEPLIIAFNIVALVLPFINIRRIGKKIRSLFVGIISFRVVGDTLDKVKRVELYYHFLSSILFSQGPAIYI